MARLRIIQIDAHERPEIAQSFRPFAPDGLPIGALAQGHRMPGKVLFRIFNVQRRDESDDGSRLPIA